jgi:hypothetical protein
MRFENVVRLAGSREAQARNASSTISNRFDNHTVNKAVMKCSIINWQGMSQNISATFHVRVGSTLEKLFSVSGTHFC